MGILNSFGNSHCFKAGSKVFTKNGYKNIEDICINDEVLTHLNRWRKVVQVNSVENKNLWKIKTRNGFKFYATANQPFWITFVNGQDFEKHEFKSVDSVTKKDYLISLKEMDGFENVDYNYDIIVYIEKTDRVITVYSLEVEEDHTYIVNDKIVHDC